MLVEHLKVRDTIDDPINVNFSFGELMTEAQPVRERPTAEKRTAN